MFHQLQLNHGENLFLKLADGDKPNQGEINSQRLYTEPEGLNIDGELPVVPKNSFKKGVYY